jgi:mannose-6-phosphate isomerase-like protein (cupin superfamily)
MSNFKFWDYNVDVDSILQQVLDNPTDWQAVSSYKNIAGDLKPYGFMPLTMAVVRKEGDNPKNSELQMNTPLYTKYTEIRKWLQSRGITEHSRAAFFKLAIGGEVLSHIDDGTYYLTRDRFHLCLQGRYLYTCGDEQHIIEPGTFFWFNNKKHHAAKQVGDVERLTFVFDVPHSLEHPANSKYI